MIKRIMSYDERAVSIMTRKLGITTKRWNMKRGKRRMGKLRKGHGWKGRGMSLKEEVFGE